MKPFCIPAPYRRFFCPEHLHLSDDSMKICRFGSILLAERMNAVGSVLAAFQNSRIQIVPSLRKADILRRKILFDSIRKLPFHDLRWSLAVTSPDIGSINSLSIYLQPVSDTAQDRRILLRYRAVRFGPMFKSRRPFLLTISTRSQISSSQVRYVLFSV